MTESEHPPKQVLADALRAGLQSRGLAISAAAVRLGLPRTSVHAFLDRNVYPASVLPGLCELAGLPFGDMEGLQERYTLGLSSRTRTASQAVSRVGPVVTAQDGHLQTLSVFFIVTEPPEWHPGFWSTSGFGQMIDRARRGARFLYIAPADEEIQRWAGSYDARALPGPGELANGFRRFARALEAEVENANDSFFFLEAGPGPFFVPFGSISIEFDAPSTDAARQREPLRATLQSETRTASGRPMPSTLELPVAFARQAARFALSAAQSSLSQSPGIELLQERIEAALAPPGGVTPGIRRRPG